MRDWKGNAPLGAGGSGAGVGDVGAPGAGPFWRRNPKGEPTTPPPQSNRHKRLMTELLAGRPAAELIIREMGVFVMAASGLKPHPAPRHLFKAVGGRNVRPTPTYSGLGYPGENTKLGRKNLPYATPQLRVHLGRKRPGGRLIQNSGSKKVMSGVTLNQTRG